MRRARIRASSVAALMLASRIPLIKAVALKTSTASPTYPTPSPLEEFINLARLREFDLALLIVWLISAAVAMISLILLCKEMSRRTFLYIDISSPSAIMQLFYFTLSDATRDYTVRVPKRGTRLTLSSYGLFGVLTFASKPWRLIRNKSHAQVDLPGFLVVPFWKLSQLRQLLQTLDVAITPLVVHTHEYVYYAGTEATPKRGGPPDYAESTF